MKVKVEHPVPNLQLAPGFNPVSEPNPLTGIVTEPIKAILRGDTRCLSGSPPIVEVRDGHTPAENTIDKDTNPKDLIASNKIPLSLVPEILVVYAALGFLEGALKYGRYNWRIAGVRSSIYIDALKRHIAAYESGEDISENGVPHFANMLACIGILIDAKVCGKLTDDRPPRAMLVPELIRSLEEDVARLKERFKNHHPHQYTIADSPKES